MPRKSILYKSALWLPSSQSSRSKDDSVFRSSRWYRGDPIRVGLSHNIKAWASSAITSGDKSEATENSFYYLWQRRCLQQVLKCSLLAKINQLRQRWVIESLRNFYWKLNDGRRGGVYLYEWHSQWNHLDSWAFLYAQRHIFSKSLSVFSIIQYQWNPRKVQFWPENWRTWVKKYEFYEASENQRTIRW